MSTNDGSCTIRRTAQWLMFLFIFSLPLLESNDWNLPSFLFVSHGRIAWTCAYSLPFRSHALSFTIAWIQLPRCNYCYACLLTTHLIALAGRPATVSVRSLNCSALGKFGSEFGRWPTIIIHSDTRVLIDSHCKHTPIQDYQSFSLCQAGLENLICETTVKKLVLSVVIGDHLPYFILQVIKRLTMAWKWCYIRTLQCLHIQTKSF